MLLTYQLPNGSSMRSSAPVLPEEWLRTDSQWMQQNADLAWLVGGGALPLALCAQRTGTATVEASPIHDAQAASGLCTAFMGEELLVSGAAQRPIRLESEVLS